MSAADRWVGEDRTMIVRFGDDGRATDVTYFGPPPAPPPLQFRVRRWLGI